MPRDRALCYKTTFKSTLDSWTFNSGYIEGIFYNKTGKGKHVHFQVDVDETLLFKGANIECKLGKIRLGDEQKSETSFLAYKKQFEQSNKRRLLQYKGMEMVYTSDTGNTFWYIGIESANNARPTVYVPYFDRIEEVVFPERLTFKFLNYEDDFAETDSSLIETESETSLIETESETEEEEENLIEQKKHSSYVSAAKIKIRQHLKQQCMKCKSLDGFFSMALIDHDVQGAVNFYKSTDPLFFSQTKFAIFNNDPESYEELQKTYETDDNVKVHNSSMEDGLCTHYNCKFGVVWLDGQKNAYNDDVLYKLGQMTYENGLLAYTISIRSSNRGENGDFRKCSQYEQYIRLNERGLHLNKFVIEKYTGKVCSGMLHVQGEVTWNQQQQRPQTQEETQYIKKYDKCNKLIEQFKEHNVPFFNEFAKFGYKIEINEDKAHSLYGAYKKRKRETV